MNNIDLGKYRIHTDLIVEDNTNVNSINNTYLYDDIKVIETTYNGNYITISFNDITDSLNREKVLKVLEKELKKILELNNISDSSTCMVIGLGNSDSTPDSLGVKTIKNVLVTKHLFKLGNVSNGIREVSAFTPGVMASTGMESKNIILAIIREEKPDFVIVIDSLASASIERVNKTIQLTDTGIHPGAGIGNNREEVSKKNIGIPVIAIGVPTVVSASTIVINTINYLEQHISYIKDNEDLQKLSFYHKNYNDKIRNKKLSDSDKNNLLGLFGNLNDNDKLSLINEVLDNVSLDLIVTPTEIDFIIDKLSNLIASAINRALHRQIY